MPRVKKPETTYIWLNAKVDSFEQHIAFGLSPKLHGQIEPEKHYHSLCLIELEGVSHPDCSIPKKPISLSIYAKDDFVWTPEESRKLADQQASRERWREGLEADWDTFKRRKQELEKIHTPDSVGMLSPHGGALTGAVWMERYTFQSIQHLASLNRSLYINIHGYKKPRKRDIWIRSFDMTTKEES